MMEPHEETGRSRALDAWDYEAPFASFHIHWGEGGLSPAFGQIQAYGIALQDLNLERDMSVMAHREVLVTFSSEHVMVGRGPAEREPAWVVMVVGTKREEAAADGVLARISPGGGGVVQLLIHARSGEILLGITIPVRLRSN